MFLKTHKCASSTVQNIFMRYGDMRNLTFVLPVDGNYLGHPAKFTPNLTLPLPSSFSATEYNIFCHHTRWQENATRQVMPQNTIYVSIIKEPAAMFESMYGWLNLPLRYGVPLTKFLRTPAKYYYNNTVKDFARNPISFDFGLETEDFDNRQRIQEKISEIDKRFSLIMLAEFMDESLVLLRDLLCWNWEDMVVFRVNARKSKYKERLSENLQKSVRDWNWADALFYDYFSTRFHNQMKKYGVTRLSEDVKTLRSLTSLWYNYCVQKEISKNDTTDVRFQVWHPSVSGFQLTPAGLKNPICVRLATAENPFTDAIRLKLWPAQTKQRLRQKLGISYEKEKQSAKNNLEFW